MRDGCVNDWQSPLSTRGAKGGMMKTPPGDVWRESGAIEVEVDKVLVNEELVLRESIESSFCNSVCDDCVAKKSSTF